jgi:hypothetical protein
MSTIKEVIASAVFPVIKAVGKIEMTNVLSDVKNRNSDEFYRRTLNSLHSSFSVLREVAHRSKTRIDDGIIDLVLEAVEERAESEGIILS